MTTKTSHMIVAAGGIGAVIALGVAVFVLRSTPVAPVARVDAPAAPVAEVPAADSATVAQLPAVSAAPAAIPAASPSAPPPDTVNHKELHSGAAAVADATPARRRDSTSANSQIDATSRVIARSAPAAAAADNAAVPNHANAAVDADSAPMTTSAPAVDLQAGPSVKLAASDSQITTEVKSAIASDGVAKDASIGVTTTDGVVALTGSVPSQAAIEQVKDVAAKVKDVKRVDTSGLIASL